MTLLDQAHARMTDAPDDAALRLRFFERLADAELFMLLEGDPKDDRISPRLFPVDGETYVLVFDDEARLAEFAAKTVPFAAMAGRKAVGMLAKEGLGLGLNLGVAPSSFLLPASGVSWLRDTLANSASAAEAKPREFRTPLDADEGFLRALDAKLAGAAGLAQSAYLVGTVYDAGRGADLLGFVGAEEFARPALRQAVAELVSFTARETTLDIAFFASDDPLIGALRRAGLRFDLPAAAKPGDNLTRTAPGMDPDKPPRLR